MWKLIISGNALLSDIYQLNQPKEGVPREKLLQKLDKKKGEEW